LADAKFPTSGSPEIIHGQPQKMLTLERHSRTHVPATSDLRQKQKQGKIPRRGNLFDLYFNH
jgi:hypothetical protein